MKEIIEKAKRLAIQEIKDNGSPAIEHFELTNIKGQELAEQFDADKDVVMLGTVLMDIKLGECLKENKLKDHVQRGSDAAREFLTQYGIDKDIIKKVINCIEAHHKDVPFKYKEAEICANADCYRFLSPKGVFVFLKLLGKRFDDFDKILDYAEAKLEEKHGILSLEICKKELEPYYVQFKDLLQKARE